MGIPVDLCRRK